MGSDGVGKEGGVGKGTNYNTCMFRRSWGGGVAPSAAEGWAGDYWNLCGGVENTLYCCV